MCKEKYSDDTKSLINLFKKEALRQCYDENWINRIMEEAMSRGEWYLQSTIIFNFQLLEKYNDREEDY